MSSSDTYGRLYSAAARKTEEVDTDVALSLVLARRDSTAPRSAHAADRSVLRSVPKLALVVAPSLLVALALVVGLRGDAARRRPAPQGRQPSFSAYLAAFNAAQYAENPSNPPVHASVAQPKTPPPTSQVQAFKVAQSACNEGAGTRFLAAHLTQTTFSDDLLWAVFVDPPGTHVVPNGMAPTAHPEVLNWYVGFVDAKTGASAFCSFGRASSLPPLPIIERSSASVLPLACANFTFSRLPAGTDSRISRTEAVRAAKGIPQSGKRLVAFVTATDPAYGQIVDGKVRPYYSRTPVWVVEVTGDYPAALYYRGPPPGPGTALIYETVLAVVNPDSGKLENISICSEGHSSPRALLPHRSAA